MRARAHTHTQMKHLRQTPTKQPTRQHSTRQWKTLKLPKHCHFTSPDSPISPESGQQNPQFLPVSEEKVCRRKISNQSSLSLSLSLSTQPLPPPPPRPKTLDCPLSYRKTTPKNTKIYARYTGEESEWRLWRKREKGTEGGRERGRGTERHRREK